MSKGWQPEQALKIQAFLISQSFSHIFQTIPTQKAFRTSKSNIKAGLPAGKTTSLQQTLEITCRVRP